MKKTVVIFGLLLCFSVQASQKKKDAIFQELRSVALSMESLSPRFNSLSDAGQLAIDLLINGYLNHPPIFDDNDVDTTASFFENEKLTDHLNKLKNYKRLLDQFGSFVKNGK